MGKSLWRRAPLWLRIVSGILILPPLGIILFVATRAFGADVPLVWLFGIAVALAWLSAFRASTPIAAALSILAVLGFGLPLYYGKQVERTFEDVGTHLDRAPDPKAVPPQSSGPNVAEQEPLGETPPGGYHYEIPPEEAEQGQPQATVPGAAIGPDLSAPSGGGGPIPDERGSYLAGEAPLPGQAPLEVPDLQPPLAQPSLQSPLPQPQGMGGGGSGSAGTPGQLPEFPWPPPSASASYVLADKLFASYRTVGDVAAAILAALEQNGYVERSFFRTPQKGVALVTRLERIDDDGSPSAEPGRWPAAAQPHESTRSLLDFLHGLFFVDPGHYRVIVFVLQDLPFSQSADTIAATQAQAWLVSGANILPPVIAAIPFGGGHVTVLIYEFASDGTKVQVVTSQLTGKQHLEKAGVLAILDKAQ